jgi:beta-N-acetylhexosaminidase
MRRWLACGVAGTSLDREERHLIERLRPGAVVLFARNVGSPEELRALVGSLRALAAAPYVAVDLEGGVVNRLRPLIGELPAAADAAAAGTGALQSLGLALGAACAHFGIGVDFAPVLDTAREGGWLARERRCFAETPMGVETSAATVLAGIESFGVAACLKHYPGLGSGGVDSHRDLPLLDERVDEDAEVFHRLARPSRAVMVAHALAPGLGEGVRPASLSPVVLARLRRSPIGPVIADDLEMGALAEFGTLAERAAAALHAGCDQVLLCNALAQREEVAAYVESWAERDPVLAAALESASRRLGGFGRDSLRVVQWDEVVEAANAARRLGRSGA